jgi:AcrR family transcriptional regulator
LRATIQTLDEHGLEGTTVPRIAAAAGVAPATIYRRFRDREALLRAAFLDVLEASRKANRGRVCLENFKTQTLKGVIEEIAGLTIRQYRSHPGIMKALIRFVENDSDEAFRRRALALNAQNFEPVVDLLMTFKDEIRHDDPRRAILFGLLTMGTVVEECAIESVSMWPALLPLTDEEFKHELVRAFVAYLRF